MTRGRALTHLVRMRDMKVRRLAEYRGTDEDKSFLRADIAALNYAIALIEAVRAVGEDGFRRLFGVERS